MTAYSSPAVNWLGDDGLGWDWVGGWDGLNRLAEKAKVPIINIASTMIIAVRFLPFFLALRPIATTLMNWYIGGKGGLKDVSSNLIVVV